MASLGWRPGGREEGKGEGGLPQPLPFGLALTAGPRAMVASRDLWTQGRGKGDEEEEINKVDQIGGAPPPLWDQAHRACPAASWLSLLWGQAQNRLGQERGQGKGAEAEQTPAAEP